MANTLLSPSMIAKEALMAFKNKLGFTSHTDRQYSGEFAVSGAKIGSSITIRKPPRFTVSNGAVLVNQDVTEESASLTLSSQKHVAFNFNSKDLTLTVDKFRARYLDNAVVALANQVDMDGLLLAKNSVANFVGTPGTSPATALVYLQGQQKLDEMACMRDNKRAAFITPGAQATTVDGLKGLFQSSDRISKQYENGLMGQGLGADFYMAQNIATHTVGAYGGTPLVNGASQTGASLVTDGWTNSITGVLKQGDVFTIAGVHAVNPITKQALASLQQFLVTADANSGATTGPATVSIYPSIVTSGALQTVDASPADNAAITVVSGTASTGYAQNILCHEKAFTLGTADLVKPNGVDFAAVASDEESGLSIRIVRAYDINNDAFPCRLDILYGWAALRPEWACRISS